MMNVQLPINRKDTEGNLSHNRQNHPLILVIILTVNNNNNDSSCNVNVIINIMNYLALYSYNFRGDYCGIIVLSDALSFSYLQTQVRVLVG